MSTEGRRIAAAPRPGPCQRVELHVQDDGTVWAQVTRPRPGLDVEVEECTRLFAEAPATDEATERSFQRACWWAQQLLDFRTAPPG